MGRNAAFARDFRRVMEASGERQDQVARMVALELTSGMVEKSPVDTGRFKNNWFAQIGAVNTTTTEATGNESVARAQPVIDQFAAGMRIYITNSLPYARPLEYGHSGRAPQGMVRLTIADYGQYLRGIVQQLKEQGR